jgi:ATP-binding cassette, subfamily C (CFTR/MRP), member 1
LVAAFGVVLGAAAIWYLLKKCPPQPVKQNWHFYAKLVSDTAAE